MSSTKADIMPCILDIELPDSDLIDDVHAELTRRAASDPDRCFGYFPALNGVDGIDSDLPASKLLEARLPQIEVKGLQLNCNFFRRSLIRQSGDSPFHLDTDADTAVTGEVDTLSTRLVWRLLINLSVEHSRKLAYLDEDPERLLLQARGGYVHCPDDTIDPDIVRCIDLKPREGRLAQAVLFCSSRVLHTGADGEAGHFVAGYGTEELIQLLTGTGHAGIDRR